MCAGRGGTDRGARQLGSQPTTHYTRMPAPLHRVHAWRTPATPDMECVHDNPKFNASITRMRKCIKLGKFYDWSSRIRLSLTTISRRSVVICWQNFDEIRQISSERETPHRYSIVQKNSSCNMLNTELFWYNCMPRDPS